MSFSLLFALAVGVATPAEPDSLIEQLMSPGVSRELAEWRARTISDVRYDLRLDVTGRDSARGEVIVRFRSAGREPAILDFRGIRLAVPQVNGRDAPMAVHNGAHLLVPAAALRAGENEIRLQFIAAIAPAGASIIRYRDAADETDYLYTLLVPADANQLFPSFDQPDLKARVRLSLTTPAEWRAVSNGAIESDDIRGSTRTFRFAETRPISTYLIAFAAGPWATVTGTAGGHEMTLYVRRSRAREVEADSLLALNGRALAWMEDYFGIPYPFGKYDFVLAPAFPFGGMEHPGAVFYSEERFVFRERPTRNQRIARAATIYHEVAHQWFGDLVTMRWFDDLWLKEGFATYMAARVQDALEPEADAWKTFYLRNKPLAYGVDVTEGTTPVWQALGNLDQAKSAYGPVVYNKAPAILKQLEYLVGESRFQEGVRRFLERHAFGNASWMELLRAIAGDGDALDAWGDHFILRPGMPELEQQLMIEGGRIAELALVQRPARALSGAEPWPMRVEVLLAWEDGRSERIPVTLSGTSTTVAQAAGYAAPAFVFANAGDYGYVLTQLDDRSSSWLERNIGRVDDAFLRAMLWGAMWDGVRATRIDPRRFLEMAVRELPAERDDQIVAGILSRVVRVTNAYLSTDERDARLANLERFLRSAAEDTTRSFDVRKLHFDAFVDIAATEEGARNLDAVLDADSVAGAPLRAPTRWAIVTRLLELAAPTAGVRFAAEAAADTTTDGLRRAFVAGAARPDSAVKASYFHRYLHDEALNEDWATASLGAFNSLRHQALTTPYLEPALDALPWIQQHRRIFFLSAWLSAFLNGQASEQAHARVRAYLEAHSAMPPDLRAKILQAADELERTVRIRARWAGADG